MILTRLQEIEARLAQATPGPWTFHSSGGPESHRSSGYSVGCVSITAKNPNSSIPDVMPFTKEDAIFIVHAPTDLAYLLARLKAAEEVCKCSEYALHMNSEEALTRLVESLTTWQQAKGEG